MQGALTRTPAKRQHGAARCLLAGEEFIFASRETHLQKAKVEKLCRCKQIIGGRIMYENKEGSSGDDAVSAGVCTS